MNMKLLDFQNFQSKELKEYKLLKYKNISSIKKYVNEINNKKIVLMLMQKQIQIQI